VRATLETWTRTIRRSTGIPKRSRWCSAP
jgi:hypothetical protein